MEVFFYIPPAPSAAPTSVSVSAVTSSSITVQWGAVDCIHRNGDITGYSVQYGSGSTQTMSVSGGSVTEATISSLMSSTTYSIQVAAVNIAGTGPYNFALDAMTDGTQIDLRHSSIYICLMVIRLFSFSIRSFVFCLFLIHCYLSDHLMDTG